MLMNSKEELVEIIVEANDATREIIRNALVEEVLEAEGKTFLSDLTNVYDHQDLYYSPKTFNEKTVIAEEHFRKEEDVRYMSIEELLSELAGYYGEDNEKWTDTLGWVKAELDVAFLNNSGKRLAGQY